MSGLALVEMHAGPGPVSRAALARQVECVRLPERSTAVLQEAGLGPQASGLRKDTTQEAKAVGAGLRRIVELLSVGDGGLGAYRSAVTQLVGLGPGLTPTGDDLLVAVLATARRLEAGGLVDGAAARRLAAALARIPAGKTTGVAHDLLAGAAEGRFPSPLVALVDALGDERTGTDALAALVERLLAVGAHSGADWLTGVVALSAACLISKGEECPIS